MPTPPPNDTPRQESVEEILKEFRKKYLSTKHDECEDGWYSCPKSENYFGNYEDTPIGERVCYCDVKLNEEKIDFLRKALTTAYTQGRASMRSDIIAVMPEECNDFGLVNSYRDGRNNFRDELLGKIGGIE